MRDTQFATLIKLFAKVLVLFISGTSSAAVSYDCKGVNILKSQYDQVKQAYQAAQTEVDNLRAKWNTLPSDAIITAANADLANLEKEMLKAQSASGSSGAVPTPTSAAVNHKRLSGEIQKLSQQIAILDLKIKTLEANADRAKQDKQREIQDLFTNSIDARLFNLTSVSPSAVPSATLRDSKSFSEWISHQKDRFNADAEIIRNNRTVSLPLDQLTAEELAQYDVVTSEVISGHKTTLRTLFARQDELKKQIDAGTITSANKSEWNEYKNQVPNKISWIKRQLAQAFEVAFTDALNQLSDFEKDINRLEKLEKEMEVKTKLDIDAIQIEKKQLQNLQQEKQNKEVELSQLNATSGVRNTASLSAMPLNELKDKIQNQKIYIAGLKANKAKWEQVDKKFEEQKHKFESYKKQAAEFKVNAIAASKKSIEQANAIKNSAKSLYETKSAAIKNNYARVKQLLVQKRGLLINKANNMLKIGSYNSSTRAALLKEWSAFKTKLNAKAKPLFAESQKVKSAASNQVRSAILVLAPFNCQQFPEVIAVRNKLIDIEKKLTYQLNAPEPNILGVPIDLPNISTTMTTVSGFWNSNYGCTTLRQKGNAVSGLIHYTNGKKGRLRGVIKNDILSFKWSNATDRGTGSLKLSTDGRSLQGAYRDKKGRKGGWYLSRRNGRCQ